MIVIVVVVVVGGGGGGGGGGGRCWLVSNQPAANQILRSCSKNSPRHRPPLTPKALAGVRSWCSTSLSWAAI